MGSKSKLYFAVGERNVRQICMIAVKAKNEYEAEKLAMKTMCLNVNSPHVQIINQRVLMDQKQEIGCVKPIQPYSS